MGVLYSLGDRESKVVYKIHSHAVQQQPITDLPEWGEDEDRVRGCFSRKPRYCNNSS